MNDIQEPIFKRECVFLLDTYNLNEIHGEDCIKKIMKWVEASGGRVVQHNSPDLSLIDSPTASYIVTEHESDTADIPCVNLVYLFACFQSHRVLRHQCYGPLPRSVPENHAFSEKKGEFIGSFSGFVGRERVLVEVMMQSLGMTCFRTMSINGPQKADVLVASDTEEESHKILAARGVGIPVVNVKWLWDSFNAWEYLSVGDGGYQGRAGVDCIVVEEDDCAVVKDTVCIPDSTDAEYSSTPSHAPTEDDEYQQLGTVLADDDDNNEDQELLRNHEEEEEEKAQYNDEVFHKSTEQQHVQEIDTSLEREPMQEEDALERKNKDITPMMVRATAAGKRKASPNDMMEGLPAHLTLSGMHTVEQKQCLTMLRASSFRYTVGSHDWDPKFTHVITPSMRRNQKCLCALASGRWILRPEFLRDNQDTGHEEDYEISDGNPSNGIDDNICRFWRESPQRPFEGLICGMYRIPPSSIPSRKDIRSILQAGGGTICSKSNLESLNTCDIVISVDESITESISTTVLTPASLVIWLVSPSTDLAVADSKYTVCFHHPLVKLLKGCCKAQFRVLRERESRNRTFNFVMAETVQTIAPQVQVDKAEEHAPLSTAHRHVGSSVQTPDITGGDDIGGHISDDAGNEVAKGDSSMKAVQQQNFDASDTMSTQDANVMVRTGSTPPPDAMDKADGGEGRQHHLLRHSLPSEQRGTSVVSHFGVDTISDAAKLIKKMSQRDLQAKFKAVYGTKTFSNNNNWLRRKLFEAIGMDPGKSATKKASAGGPRRRRAASTVKSTSATATRRIKPPLRYARRTKAEMEEEQHSVAEALLALADTSETPLLKDTRRVQTINSDGIVPGRDDELSWSSRGRDVPGLKEEPALPQSPQLPTAPPLVDTSQDAMMSSMMEYFAMMQRMMMHQPPENQHAMMSMFSGQQSPTQQAQVLQQMQQLQQIQQMQMLMAMQSNPNMMQAMQQSYSHPHTEYVKTLQEAIAAQTGGSHAFASAQSGSLQGSYPDIFMSRKTE